MRKTSAVRLLLAAVSVASVFACGDHVSPTSPSLTLKRTRQSQGQSQNGQQLAQCDIQQQIQVSKRIGPRGGTLDLGDDNKVYFPPGAVPRDTTITARVPAGSTARVIFTPEGLRFPVPAVMTLNVSPCVTPTALLTVVYLQADTVSEVRPTVNNPGTHTVTTTIEHFSSYAVAY